MNIATTIINNSEVGGVDVVTLLIAIIIALVQAIIFGLASSKIADEKGRSSAGWFWLGFFLGIIGVMIASCLSIQHARTSDYRNTENYIDKLSK